MPLIYPVGFMSASGSGPIGTPVGIGSLNKSTSSSITATFTTGANILAADLLVIAISTLGTTVSSVSDGTNSFTLAKRQQNGGGTVEIWYKENATAVGSGATITVTFAGATFYCSAGLARVPTAATSSSLDQIQGGTALPITTATLTYAKEVVFGATGGYNFTSATEDAAFTNLYTISNGGQVSLSFGRKSVSATTAVSYQPTGSLPDTTPCYAEATFH